MRAIDRVMRAYLQTHRVTDAQAALVRAELSEFIDGLLAGTDGVADPEPNQIKPSPGETPSQSR